MGEFKNLRADGVSACRAIKKIDFCFDDRPVCYEA